mgnify:CR=1 FL=1
MVFGFGKKKQPDDTRPDEDAQETEHSASAQPEELPKQGMLARLREKLGRTRSNLTDGLADLLLGRKQIDDALLEELETLLLTADVGIEATQRIIGDITGKVSRKELSDPEKLNGVLKQELAQILADAEAPEKQPAEGRPRVILMVGINGAGKTTTIGKLARKYQAEGKSVMLAAGDTFRAAAVEQLQSWGERNNVPVIAQHTGADSASVIYDAVDAATARRTDILIADTAGRLHTKTNLMDELTKIVRVMRKIDPGAPHEVMLVVDGGTGQNALQQAIQFNEAVGLTGITITKLDGTARGGILFAIADKLRVPIRFIGVGEGIDDEKNIGGPASAQSRDGIHQIVFFQKNTFTDGIKDFHCQIDILIRGMCPCGDSGSRLLHCCCNIGHHTDKAQIFVEARFNGRHGNTGRNRNNEFGHIELFRGFIENGRHNLGFDGIDCNI